MIFIRYTDVLEFILFIFTSIPVYIYPNEEKKYTKIKNYDTSNTLWGFVKINN